MDPSALSTPRPRHQLPAPPDPASQLLEAVRRRDPQSTLLLAQRWVHRRGLASLEGFRHGTLTADAGREASAWLAALLTQPGPAASGKEGQEPVSRPTNSDRPRQSPGLQEGPAQPAERQPLEQRVISEVDAAIAAMLATFAQEELSSPVPQAHGGMATADAPAIATVAVSERPAEGAAAGHTPESAEPPVTWEAPFSWPFDAVVGEGADSGQAPCEPEPQMVEESSWAEGSAEVAPAREGLRQRLRRQLPAAAWVLRHLLAAAEPAAWWRAPATVDDDPDPTQGPASAEAWTAALQDGDSEAGEEPEARVMEPEGRVVEPAATVQAERLVRPLTALPGAVEAPSAAERLRQRLSRPSTPGTDLPPPAPRPYGLAELGSWLPDSDLPRAS